MVGARRYGRERPNSRPICRGACAFLARAFVERMPVHIHTAILDVVVIAGGVVMIISAARSLL